jgi:hypothetical protein
MIKIRQCQLSRQKESAKATSLPASAACSQVPGHITFEKGQNGNFQFGMVQVGIPVDRDRSFRFVVTGDSGLS